MNVADLKTALAGMPDEATVIVAVRDPDEPRDIICDQEVVVRFETAEEAISDHPWVWIAPDLDENGAVEVDE